MGVRVYPSSGGRQAPLSVSWSFILPFAIVSADHVSESIFSTQDVTREQTEEDHCSCLPEFKIDENKYNKL